MNPRITNWAGLRVWVVGGSTGIGAALAEALLRRGARLAVSARREGPLRERLAAMVQRGDTSQPGTTGQSSMPTSATEPIAIAADVSDLASVTAAHERLIALWGSIDLVVWMAGTYTPMRAQDYDHARALEMVRTNLDGVLNGLSVLLPNFMGQRRGHLAIVSSVAGYGGLPRSLIYGPTKAALNNLCESLYMDLHPLNIGVTLVCPGFVATPLTAGNDFHMPALLTADEAALKIIAGLEKGRFEIHFPYRFTLWLKLLRLLPRSLYLRLVGRTAANLPAPASAPGRTPAP